MELLTGVFIVALYKATEKIWEKGFDAAWAPVDEALTRAGRADPARLEQARLIFERMLGYANHLGLYAEETGPRGETMAMVTRPDLC